MRTQKVCIVGMGYVGLTLAAVMAERGFQVLGVELDPKLLESLNRCEPHFHEPGLKAIMRNHLGRNLFMSSKMPQDSWDAFIIAVGTPWDPEKERPVIEHVERAAKQVASCYHPGALVVVRSTVPVGTSRQTVLPILQEKASRVLLAYCPERTAEGIALQELRELPQIIGGLDEESVDAAQEVFRHVTHTSIEVSSLEAAELIKLIDNSHRDLSFAFANEVGLLCEGWELDPLELIRSANTAYSRTRIPVPGFVGGACLTKDPHILAYSARQKGREANLVHYARKVNESLPPYTFDKLLKMMGRAGKGLKGSKVLLAGLAFKGQPETDDLRGSASLVLRDLLKNQTHPIYGHDFVASTEEIARHGFQPCSLEEGFLNADAALFLNNHKGYPGLDIASLASTMNKPAVILDCWRLFQASLVRDIQGISYGSIGFE